MKKTSLSAQQRKRTVSTSNQHNWYNLQEYTHLVCVVKIQELAPGGIDLLMALV
jgi:hypothetical protein